MAIQDNTGKVIPFPVRAKHFPLEGGDRGVAVTIALMSQVVQAHAEGAMNPIVRTWAVRATQNAPDRDDKAQASAIYYAVKNNIKFRGEFSETVQTPLLTLQLRAGDCDDHAVLIVGLLRSLGIPARFDTVATDATGQFVHVFALAGIRQNGRVVSWLALDTTVPAAVPGWRPPIITREKLWGRMEGLAGLGDDPTPSQKAQDAISVINAGGNAIANVAAAINNRRNTANLFASRTGNSVSASAGASPQMWAIGAVVALGGVLLLRGRR